MDLLDRVRRTIRRHRLADPATRVVAAVSGGSDSVALARLLDALDRHGELRLVGLAHFNHQLRETADRDEEFCVRLATSLNRSFIADRGDVRRLAHEEQRSMEDAARAARHRFLERTRLELQADVIALGHTRDDQAETFLLRLLRGAGAKGLGSMYPRRGALIRPVLDCRRMELRTYLEEQRLSFVHDESNDDVQIPRNRVRAELIPLLQQRFNPSIVDVLADEAELARDEHGWLEAETDVLWPSVYRAVENRGVLDGDVLRDIPPAVARTIVRRAMNAVAGGRGVTFTDVERVLALLDGEGGSFDAPGQRVERIDGDVVLTGRPVGAVGRTSLTAGTANLFHYPLSIPGEVLLAESHCRVTAEVAPSFEPGAVSGRDVVAAVRFDKCNGVLAVRNRRPGDRFRPVGLGGRKKLQDFFVDRKVARDRRDLVPIVVNASDQIVWVAGHAIDEDFRVTDAAQAVIILRLKGLGGSA